MKANTKENLKLTALALLFIAVVFPIGLALEIHHINFEKWFGLIWWTAIIFGLLASLYSRDLRKFRCLAVFLGFLAIHASALFFYLRHATAFPNLFFLFFSPLEGAAIGVMLFIFGGAKPHREWRAARRRSASRREGTATTRKDAAPR